MSSASIPAEPLLRLQPHPVKAIVSVVDHGDGTHTTVIARLFRPADVPRCRLCPLGQCSADDGFCQIAYPGLVPDHLAALHGATAVDRD